MKVVLKVTSGPLAGKVYTFNEPQGFTFGRAKDCSCVVENDNTFSRHHFLLEVNPPEVWLRDLGSLNGTYVNGRKVGGRPTGVAAEEAEPGNTVPLCCGCEIQAGEYKMTLKVNAAAICVDCGKEISPDQRRPVEFVGGSYLCLKCRKREEEKQQSEKEKAATSKKKAFNERLNPEQQARAEENPAAIIEELFKQILQKEGRVEGYPEIMDYQIEGKLGEVVGKAMLVEYKSLQQKKFTEERPVRIILAMSRKLWAIRPVPAYFYRTYE